ASSLAQREAWAETFSLVVSTLPTPSISAAMRLASSTWAWLSTLPVRKTTPSTVSTSILVPATSLSASRLDFTLVVIQVSETGWLESASAAFFFCGSLSAPIAAPENITAVRATARMEAFLRRGYLLGWSGGQSPPAERPVEVNRVQWIRDWFTPMNRLRLRKDARLIAGCIEWNRFQCHRLR